MAAFALLALAVLASLLVHLLAMASEGLALGGTVEEFKLGFGPRLLRAGRLSVGLLPFGGHVRFAARPPAPVSLAAELSQALVGPLALLALAWIGIGGAAPAAVADGFVQWVTGAASPFLTARRLLESARSQALGAPFLSTVGVVAAKVCAANLMPLLGTNGWHVLATLGRRLGLARLWPDGASLFLLAVQLLMLGSWLVALAAFVVGP